MQLTASASHRHFQRQSPATTAGIQRKRAIRLAEWLVRHFGKFLQSIVKMFQYLFHSDNAKANATLDALKQDLMKDKKKRDKFQAGGGCFALVHVMQDTLYKATDECPARDQVTELNELAELTTLYKTLEFIISWTSLYDDRTVGSTAIGGVEADV
jgi:hypothetical protein